MANIKKNSYNEIITVNLSTKEIEAMKSFVLTKDRKRKRKIIDEEIDAKSCFSRCEWVRFAVKRLLLKEIQRLKQENNTRENYEEFNHNHQDKVKIPLSNGECKEYKIIARLE